MSSKTKIVVLRLKELIYTGIFVVLGILFIILLVMMFMPAGDKKDNTDTETAALYVPGVYTTSIVLNDNTVDIEVTVDSDNINSINLRNLDEAVATMYPLIEPSLADLASQICSNQSVEGLTYSDSNKYTSLVLLDAIKTSLEKAKAEVSP